MEEYVCIAVCIYMYIYLYIYVYIYIFFFCNFFFKFPKTTTPPLNQITLKQYIYI